MTPEKEGLPEIIVPPEDLVIAGKLLDLMDLEDYAALPMGMRDYSGDVTEGVGYCFRKFEIDPNNIDMAKVAELKKWTTTLLQQAGHLPRPVQH